MPEPTRTDRHGQPVKGPYDAFGGGADKPKKATTEETPKKTLDEPKDEPEQTMPTSRHG